MLFFRFVLPSPPKGGWRGEGTQKNSIKMLYYGGGGQFGFQTVGVKFQRPHLWNQTVWILNPLLFGFRRSLDFRHSVFRHSLLCVWKTNAKNFGFQTFIYSMFFYIPSFQGTCVWLTDSMQWWDRWQRRQHRKRCRWWNRRWWWLHIVPCHH